MPLCRQIGSWFTDFLFIEVISKSDQFINKILIFFEISCFYPSIVISDCRFVSVGLYRMDDKEYHTWRTVRPYLVRTGLS
jgi:hypothetical protein